MDPRFAILAMLAALGVAAIPVTAIADECSDAQGDFWNAWAEEGEAFTRPVALAARAALDACPEDAAEPLPTSGMETQLEGKTMAALCGFVGTTTSPTTRSTVRGLVRVGMDPMDSDVTTGWGLAEFNAASGYTRVRAAGGEPANLKWGIDVNNEGSGVVSYYGVPFPLTRLRGDLIKAEAGCGVPPGPNLCWGFGEGGTQVPNAFFIWVQAEFYDCWR